MIPQAASGIGSQGNQLLVIYCVLCSPSGYKIKYEMMCAFFLCTHAIIYIYIYMYTCIDIHTYTSLYICVWMLQSSSSKIHHLRPGPQQLPSELLEPVSAPGALAAWGRGPLMGIYPTGSMIYGLYIYR